MSWFNREEAHRAVSDLRQVARIDRLGYQDGPARGSRLLRLVTGGGLEVELLPDRGLDLGTVTIDGIPVGWASAAQPAVPSAVDLHGANWVRSFAGGLLVTCGLDSFGAHSVEDGVEYGQHGRATALSAKDLSTRSPRTPADPPVLSVSGVMQQGALFAENLLWRRTVEAALGGRSVTITDEITNLGAHRAAHLVLYHLNFGWPLVSEQCRIGADPSPLSVTARDADSEPGVEAWRSVPAPGDPDTPEQVLVHRLPVAQRIRYSVANPSLGIEVGVEFDSAQLPVLHQWRLTRQREYVIALEPATAAAIDGRAAANRRGAVPFLEPDETRTTSVTFDFGRRDPR